MAQGKDVNRDPQGATLAYIGLGANLGDARDTLARACAELAELPDTKVTSRSALYRSAPIDASGPEYVNAVVALETALAPEALHEGLRAIENRFGRARGERNAPRTLDLDLLLYGNRKIDTAELTVPHPRMHRRAFVLVPLAELAPQLVVPGHGPIVELTRRCADQDVEALVESR